MMNHLQEVTIESIIEADEAMKQIETEYNPYRSVLVQYNNVVDFGLTPVIYVDPSAMKFYITTRERQEKKLN